MNLIYFGYERDLGIDQNILYLDGDMIHDENRDDIIQKIKAFKPDLFIEREFADGKSSFLKVYRAFPKVPKAWYMIDLHCNMIEHIAYAKMCEFTYIFAAQSWFIPLLQNQVKAQLFWLPLCHTQTLPEYTKWLAKPKPKRTIELSFVGNIRSIHVDRMKYVTDIKKKLGDKFEARNQSYDLMLETLAASKQTFNCSLNDDLNFRVWEALATNTPLVTDFVADIPKISNLSRYITTIYLKDTETRLTEASEYPHLDSTNYIFSGHTITHRINQILWMIQSGSQWEY